MTTTLSLIPDELPPDEFFIFVFPLSIRRRRGRHARYWRLVAPCREDDGSVARGVAGALPGVCGEFGAVKLTIQLCLAEQQRGQ